MIGSLVLLLLQQPIGQPPAFVAMRQARCAVQTADIRWTFQAGAEPKVERRFRLSPVDRAYIREPGPQDAVEVSAFQDYFQTELSRLMDDDGTEWTRSPTIMTVAWFRPPANARVYAPLPNALTIGQEYALFRDDRGESIDELIISFLPEAALPDGNVAVTAELSNDTSVTWLINPEKQWSTQRIESHSSDGTPLAEIEFELTQSDGIWFPARAVARLSATGEVISALEVHSAEFNRPDHPRDFTPAVLGAEPGFGVWDYLHKGCVPGDPPLRLVWDGEKPIERDVWMELRRAGAAQNGPSVASFYERAAQTRELRASGVPDELTPDLLDQWERYVRRFCRRYGLDDRQIEEANKLLAACHKRAVASVERDPVLKGAFEELKSQCGTNAEWFRLARSFCANNSRALRPVREIFEKELQPRLFRIPTKAQVEAAGDPESIRRRK